MDRAEPPPQVVEREVQFSADDGVILSGRYWEATRSRGNLVIAHGLGEHGGCYRELAENLVATLDINVLAFDFRGHGRSSGKRGVVRHYDEQQFDLVAAIRHVRQKNIALPTFVLGHSNGGLVALDHVLKVHLTSVEGLILSNPALKLLAIVPTWKRLMGAFLLKVAPRITLDTSISDEDLTADPAALAAIANDPLRHSRISPPLYFGMLDAGQSTLARANQLTLPTLLLLGGADPLIDPEVGRRFFDDMASADKTLKIYPGMKHEPLQEQGREAVVGEIKQWLGDRLTKRQSVVSDAQG